MYGNFDLNSIQNRLPAAYHRRPTGARSVNSARLIIALCVACFSLISYFKSSSYNPVTGEKQYISLAPHQEIALGLEAVPQMMEQYGGESHNSADRARVNAIGHRLVERSKASETEWPFEFYLLNDADTINAFALPGGQVFITEALYQKLSDAQLAGVLGHEMGHVIARHGAQQMAKAGLTQGLVGAVSVASDNSGVSQMASMIGNMVNMKYGREDELQSDQLGILFMAEAGYDPNAMIGVMKILEAAAKGERQPEFFSTHPNPENRVGHIQSAIQKLFPNGLPSDLEM